MPKSRNKSNRFNRQRKVGTRNIQKRVLIVCEGTQTEPNYFEGLRKEFERQVLITIPRPRAGGKASLSLVEYAKILNDKDGEYDEVWCVFDRDLKKENYNQQNFNQAIITAQQNNFKLAISNDAFELWFILHYEYYCSKTHRSKYKAILEDKRRLGKDYEKNSNEMYELLKPLQIEAIKNAKTLWERCESEISLPRDKTDKLINLV